MIFRLFVLKDFNEMRIKLIKVTSFIDVEEEVKMT